MNLLLFFVVMIATLAGMLLAYRHSIVALYVLLSVLYVITNLTAGKIIIVDFYFFAVPASAAAPLYASIFLGTDIIAETVNKRAAFYAVWFGLLSLAAFLGIGLLINAMVAVPDNQIGTALEGIFSFAPRLVCGSIIAYVVSQHFDVIFFHYLKKLHGKRLLWLRNNLSTIISQFIDSLLVFSIAFAGVVDNWIMIMLSTYVIKVIVALCDTPFVYLARGMGCQHKLGKFDE